MVRACRGISLLLIAACLLSLSCAARGQDAAAKHAAAADISRRASLRGGDPKAWLTPAGDAADSRYCDAELQLPLARQTQWIYTYTAARFSSEPPQQILHYDGLLLVQARSPQVLILDARSGALRSSDSVYRHAMVQQGAETMTGLFLHPQGLAVGLDDTGRYYCWDVVAGKLKELWVSEPTGERNRGYVVTNDSLLTTWEYRLRGLDVLSGRQRWEYPVLIRSFGIVVSDRGETVWWSYYGDVNALSSSGKLLWSSTGDTYITRVTLDNARRCALVCYHNDRLECRDLVTGAVRFTHRWGDLLSAKERERLGRESGYFNGQGGTRVWLLAGDPVVAPEGYYLTLISGDTIALDLAGKRRWRHQSGVTVSDALAFRNGLLVSEQFYYPHDNVPAWDIVPFTLKPPPWRSVRGADGKTLRDGAFERYIVLDKATGRQLDAVEMEFDTSAGPTPAYDNIVFGDDGTGGQRRILAFKWLKAEEH